ncbi:MAG TPA: hypothetical protein VFV99_02465 [Kofleriaceae bacterium]|nr:hypothetical protein [Kofleriaceae bacterium]
MVRLAVVWSVVLAACTFEHGIPVPGGSGNNPDAPVVSSPDGPVLTPVDAPTVLPVDATPVDAPCGDADSDGVCDNVDDWPCGAKPTDPGTMMTMTGSNGATSIRLTQVNLAQMGRYAVATSQQNISIAFSYDIKDTSCAGNCVDQIEIGWVPGGRSGCPFDNAVSKQNGASGNISTMIRTPTNKGSYDLRANIGQNYSCTYNGASGWWGGTTPSASRTIARLCVH